MGIALIMLMAGFIKICSVHTPSSNPKLPPPKPLPGEFRGSQRKFDMQMGKTGIEPLTWLEDNH